jgi:hypothetical protein
MDDQVIVVDFISSIHGKIKNQGRSVTLDGIFFKQPFEGIAKLSGSPYQLIFNVNDDQRALVAILPDDQNILQDQEYSVAGELTAVGREGLFAGIVVKSLEKIEN